MAEQRQRVTVKSIKRLITSTGNEEVCQKEFQEGDINFVSIAPEFSRVNPSAKVDTTTTAKQTAKTLAVQPLSTHEHHQCPKQFENCSSQYFRQKPEAVYLSGDGYKNKSCKHGSKGPAVTPSARFVSLPKQPKVQWDEYLDCEQVWKPLLCYLDAVEVNHVNFYGAFRKGELGRKMKGTMASICTQSIGFTPAMQTTINETWMKQEEALINSAKADGSFKLPNTAKEVLCLQEKVLKEGITLAMDKFTSMGDLSVRHFVSAQTIFLHETASCLGLYGYEQSVIGKDKFLAFYRQCLYFMSLPFVVFFVLKNNEIKNDHSRNVAEELFDAIATFIDKEDYFKALRCNLIAIKDMLQHRNPDTIKKIDIDIMLEIYQMEYVKCSG